MKQRVDSKIFKRNRKSNLIGTFDRVEETNQIRFIHSTRSNLPIQSDLSILRGRMDKSNRNHSFDALKNEKTDRNLAFDAVEWKNSIEIIHSTQSKMKKQIEILHSTRFNEQIRSKSFVRGCRTSNSENFYHIFNKLKSI